MKKLIVCLALAIAATGLVAAPASATIQPTPNCVGGDPGGRWNEWCFPDGEVDTIGTTGRAMPMYNFMLGAGGREVCLRAHAHDVGWMGLQCSTWRVTVGRSGQFLEALGLQVKGPGRLCARAHVQDVGWVGWQCGVNGSYIEIGSTGQTRRLEAVDVVFYPAA